MSNRDNEPLGARRSKSVSRRNFLRGVMGGAAISVALPMFEYMLDGSPIAAANGDPIPKRFGVFYWALGVRHETWLPQNTGYRFDLPHAFADWGKPEYSHLRDYLTMVTGTSHSGSSPGHIPARGIALSSSHDMTINTGDNVGRYRGQNHPEPSIDVIVANEWEGSNTPFDHIALSVSQQRPYRNNSSWEAGGRTYNRHEPDPAALWDRLFSDVQTNQTEDVGLLRQTTALEKSMLDAVQEDTRRLNRKLGAADRQRLERHLEGLRDVERRLQQREESYGMQCLIPERPIVSEFGERSRNEKREDKNKIMADLLAHALACNLSRVFSYEFSATQSEAVYWEVGATGEHHHEYTHLASRVGGSYRGQVQSIVQFIMKNFAYLADALYRMPAADGTPLLDHTLILGTSEHADAGHHNYRDHPFVFVGKGSNIKPGHHFRLGDGSGAHAPKVLLSTVRALGIERDGFGQKQSTGSRYTDEVFNEIMR